MGAVKTHCSRGHPYDEANTYRAPGGQDRYCRTCIGNRDTAAAWARTKDATNAKRREKAALERGPPRPPRPEREPPLYPRRGSLEVRLKQRLVRDPKTGCDEWMGYLLRGYARIKREDGTAAFAHRVAYEMAKGPIPAGLKIDHLCRNTRCCNPDHLEAVTDRENILRGDGVAALASRRTHCPQEHPYSGENLHLTPRGHRVCRTCVRNRKRGNNRPNRAATGPQKKSEEG